MYDINWIFTVRCMLYIESLQSDWFAIACHRRKPRRRARYYCVLPLHRQSRSCAATSRHPSYPLCSHTVITIRTCVCCHVTTGRARPPSLDVPVACVFWAHLSTMLRCVIDGLPLLDHPSATHGMSRPQMFSLAYEIHRLEVFSFLSIINFFSGIIVVLK